MANITAIVIDTQLNDYLEQANIYFTQGKFDHALANLYRGLSLAEVLDDKRYMQRIRFKIAQAYHEQGQPEQVIEWCNIALHESCENEMIAQVIELKVLNLLRLGYFMQARTLLETYEHAKSPQMQRMLLMNLGLVCIYEFRYMKILSLERAEKYLKEAEILNKDLEDEEDVAGQLHYYFALKYIEEGLFYYAKERLLIALQMIKHKINLFHIYNELGRVSIKLLEFEEGADYLEKARNIALQYSYHYGLNYNIYYRGFLYMELFQTENACSHFLTSLYDFIRIKQYPEVSSIYLYLSQLYQSQNSEKSEKYLEEWNTYISKLETPSDVECLEEIYQWISF